MKSVENVTKVAIIGNGLMGQGISQVCTRAGKAVRLIGRNPDSLSRAMEVIEGNFGAFVEHDHATRAEAEASACNDRRGPKTGRHTASDVDKRHRFPLRFC